MFKLFKNKEFFKRFISVALPVMVSSFISFFVNFLDNIMVGSVSTEAVSGVYAANQVSFLAQMAMFGIIEGAGIFTEQFNGAKDDEHIKQCFRYKVFASFILLAIIIPCIYLFGQYLIILYSKSDSSFELILKEGKSYLYIVSASLIFMGISFPVTSSVREIGQTKYAMTSSLIAIFTNALFNLIFIILLNMGAAGAALATVIARLIECIYCLVICKIKKFSFSKGFFASIHIDKELLKKVTNKTIPLFVNEIFWTIGMMLQTLAYSQRDGVLAAISIISTVSNIFGVLITGLSTSIGVLVGSDLGSDNFKQAIEDNTNISYLGVFISLVLGTIIIALNKVIPLCFAEVDASQKLLASKLLIIYGGMTFAACLSTTSYFTLRVGGQTVLTFLLDSVTMFVLYIPVSWILAVGTTLDIVYIYLIVRSIDIIKAILGIILMKQHKWVRNLTILAKEA